LYSTFAFRHYLSQRPAGLQVGHDTGLYNGTFFDIGTRGEVVIGDFCTLVGAIISTDRRIVISDYVFIAHEVVLADSFAAIPPFRNPDAPQPTGEIGDVETSISIGNNVWIGARAVLLGGAWIPPGLFAEFGSNSRAVERHGESGRGVRLRAIFPEVTTDALRARFGS
jgi:acetyltransferase-like isoleucine patch superfamily enzyme